AGMQDVAGPIGIAQIGYRMASSGLFNLMSFFTIISVNLAIINMLPIPGLDGGRTVFLIFEFLFRKPVIGPRKENIIHLVGLLLLLGLFLYVAFNDVGRLISTY
ncbi:site-2 protease family protein, partial [bacterium]|nr:site-2 protease family protein [bacterium]MBU1026014.1 site-2 protease family protein [bacterium]